MTENEVFEEIHKDCGSLKICDYKNTGCSDCIIRQTLIKAEKAIEEIQQYRAIGTVEGYERAIQTSIENYSLYKEYKAKVKQYEAIGTVEELKEAKEQYDNINSVAESVSLSGLCDYGTAKEAVITEIKRNLDYSLKEYQKIGTVEEFKALKEKNEPKKAEVDGVRADLLTLDYFSEFVFEVAEQLKGVQE